MKTPIQEIRKISVTDAVVDSIRALIESEEYKPGEKLPTETSLCESLKVSRTPVREALRVLQTLGYVEIRPGKGAFVASEHRRRSASDYWYDVDNAKFRDFMEVRVAIECLSVRLSVERATQRQVAELEEIHNAFVEANRKQDLVQMIMLDELFHSKIISYTGNQLLVNINQQLLSHFRVYRGQSFTNKTVYYNAVEPHEKILLCFQIKDAARAVAEVNRHLEITARDMDYIHYFAAKKDEEED